MEAFQIMQSDVKFNGRLPNLPTKTSSFTPTLGKPHKSGSASNGSRENPLACSEHHYHREQSGEALIQKLETIAVSFDEEEDLTLIDVRGRVRAAFDVERVTRRFYDRFKTEHTQFLNFLEGIPDQEMERWYASVMLNRLMFIYFIQKKGFPER